MLLRVGLLVVGLLLFVYLLLELGPGEILSLLRLVGWGILNVCVVYGVHILLRAASLYQCLMNQEGLSFRHVLGIYVSGEAVKNLTFGGTLFSEPFKALLLKRGGLEPAGAFATTLTECFAHIFVGSVLALAALIYLAYCPALTELFGGGVQIAILFLAGFLLFSFLTGWFRLHWAGRVTQAVTELPWLPNRFRPGAASVYKIEDLLFTIVRQEPKRCLRIIALELLAQWVLVFELFLILTLLDLHFPPFLPVTD